MQLSSTNQLFFAVYLQYTVIVQNIRLRVLVFATWGMACPGQNQWKKVEDEWKGIFFSLILQWKQSRLVREKENLLTSCFLAAPALNRVISCPRRLQYGLFSPPWTSSSGLLGWASPASFSPLSNVCLWQFLISLPTKVLAAALIMYSRGFCCFRLKCRDELREREKKKFLEDKKDDDDDEEEEEEGFFRSLALHRSDSARRRRRRRRRRKARSRLGGLARTRGRGCCAHREYDECRWPISAVARPGINLLAGAEQIPRWLKLHEAFNWGMKESLRIMTIPLRGLGWFKCCSLKRKSSLFVTFGHISAQILGLHSAPFDVNPLVFAGGITPVVKYGVVKGVYSDFILHETFQVYFPKILPPPPPTPQKNQIPCEVEVTLGGT